MSLWTVVVILAHQWSSPCCPAFTVQHMVGGSCHAWPSGVQHTTHAEAASENAGADMRKSCSKGCNRATCLSQSPCPWILLSLFLPPHCYQQSPGINQEAPDDGWLRGRATVAGDGASQGKSKCFSRTDEEVDGRLEIHTLNY